MSISLRPLALSLTVASAALLVACGGGSDSENTVDPGNGAGNNNGGGSGVVVASVDRFVGTYGSPCVVSDQVQQVSTGQPVRLVRTLTITQVSDTEARYAERDTYYALSDTECKGGSIGGVNRDKSGNTLKFGSAVQATLGTQTVEARRVDGKMEAIGGLSSGTQVVINDLRFPGDFFMDAYEYKDLLALSVDGSKLYAGDADTSDANGYPTALDASFFLTRQP